jgi:Rps23 Pro-64 3,4-dihydroxylase Tpa1-like proline 4-hydroxylase
MINNQNWDELSRQFLSSEPFNHVIIDNFWNEEFAAQLVEDFPAYESPVWHAHYHNAIEDKKACNHWDKFPPATYRAFTYLNDQEFVNIIEQIAGRGGVKTDVGLHGGGWHCHHKGGKLNVHLDYSIHPKLKLERHYNLIVYMTPNWDSSWGGGLEIWDHNEDGSQKSCVKTVENKFNRAVLFDTTQHSWHGLPDDLQCPEGVNRQSMAVYYLTEPAADANPRGKALFAPHKEQANDPEVLDLIKKRSSTESAAGVYKK